MSRSPKRLPEAGALVIGDRFYLPADAVTQTFGILAVRGVGKTYTAAVMAEEMVSAGSCVVVIDPVGVWWGLRSSADGTSPGLPVLILGGDRGDVPLEATAGSVVADFVTEERRSIVIDLSLFRKGEQTRFMTDFAETLYRKNRAPLHLVIDEADAVAPQRPQRGEERLLGAIEDLVRRGRARGIGVTLVTQRAAVLNKNVLTQIEVLIALRTIAPQDRHAIDEWIRVHGTPEQRETMMASLAALPKGEAWFWSPGWLDIFQRVQVRRRRTFDSSATPDVRAGPTPIVPIARAEVDLEALKSRMAATIKRVEQGDPVAMRRRITALERELAERAAPPKQPALTPEQEQLVGRLLALLGDVRAVLAAPAWAELLPALGRPHDATNAPSRPTRPPAPAATPAAKGATSEGLRAGARKMLAALAQFQDRGGLTREQLGTLAGFAPSGGTFTSYLSSLRKAGLVDEPGASLLLTARGIELAPKVAPLTAADVRALWNARLRAGERKMLEAVLEALNGLPRADLAERTGFEPSGGTFTSYLSTLRRNGLVDVRGNVVYRGPAFAAFDDARPRDRRAE